MKLFGNIKNFFQSRNPRYFYQLDEIRYQKSTKSYLYVFKIYGSPSFAKLTFDEIKANQKLRWHLHPDDLVKIYLHEERLEAEKNKYRIKETLQKNRYTIFSQEKSVVLTGDEFCRDPAVIEQTSSLDVHRISYQTGFQSGRIFAKEMQTEIEQNRDKKDTDNVVSLSISKK